LSTIFIQRGWGLINSKILIQPNESPKAYRIRLYKNKDIYGLKNYEIGKLCNEAFNLNIDESAHRKKVTSYIEGYNDAKEELASADAQLENMLNDIKEEKRETQRERMKLQTEKLEYNRWQRELSRDELFEEKVIASITENLNHQEPPLKIDVIHNKKYGLLNIADMHFAKDFTIYGLRNEIINQYSPEIFYSRMNQLFNEVVEYIKKENLNFIKIFNLGDALEGFLRNSQLWTLRYGVIDSANIFGEYMGKWLRELSKYVVIEYHQTTGNHGECRLLDGKKKEHLNENIEKVTGNIIRLINENNPNFTMVENKSGFIFTKIAGFNIMGIHGEVSNLVTAIKDYSDIYDVKIHYLVAGHKHHSEFVNCGVKRGCIGVGSIVGSDDFSMSIRKAADATASFVIFEEGKGKTDEHTFVLN
jgi:hypothetical protein